MDGIDIQATVKPLMILFLVLGRIMITSKINDTIKNVTKIGLNKVNDPNVSNDSYVYKDSPPRNN